MCGISGFLDPRLSADEGDSLLARMLDSIRHRGPDGEGVFRDGALALGHRRLSIIDLSENGAQPMQRGDLVLIFNGEVYNYVELKQELITLGHRFIGDSDTEVVLAAFRQWGEDAVKRFMGMWAFVIWNRTTKTLFASRDRFGIKPFNYIYRDGRFHFASEFRALKLSPVFTSDLNLTQVSRGLQLGWTGFGEETYFNCIRQLPQGCNLKLEDGRLSISRYWNLDPERRTPGTFESHCATFREMMQESFRLHNRSDVEVGGCLSGGLDSSAIASLSGTLSPGNPFRTFTIYYTGAGEVDERPFADQVINTYPNIRPHYLEPTADDIRSHWDDFVNAQEIPPPGSSPFSQFFVMKLAKSHGMKVLLDGQGSDEYLCGYHHTFFRIYGNWIRQMKWGRLWKELRTRRELLGWSGKEQRDIVLKSLAMAFRTEEQYTRLEYARKFPRLIPDVKPEDAVMLPAFTSDSVSNLSWHLLFSTTLPSLLHFEDRNSMWFSIESRVPFLDHRLVEFAFSIPEEEKVKDTWTKRILRESMKGILPESIRMRTDKKGFVTPGEKKWLSGPLKHLLDFNPSRLDFLDTKAAASLLEQYKAGDTRNGALVWRLAALNGWVG